MKRLHDNRFVPICMAVFLMFVTLTFGQLMPSSHAQSSTQDTTSEPMSGEQLAQQVEDQYKLWRDLQITDYTLHLDYMGVWEAYRSQVRVIDNHVVEMQVGCEVPLLMPCHLSSLKMPDYDVDRLFQWARQVAESNDGRWATITFDETYHFPTSITYNNTEVTDSLWWVEVTDFRQGNWPLTGSAGGTPSPIEQDLFATMTQIAVDHANGSPPAVTEIPRLTATPTPTRSTPGQTRLPMSSIQPPFDENLPTWIDEAEAHWEALELSNYDLSILWTGAWSGMRVSLQVRDNRLTLLHAVCESGWLTRDNNGCALSSIGLFVPTSFANELTIPGLFEKVRAVAQMPMPLSDPLEFSDTYGFPTSIYFDDPDWNDEEWEIEVLSFTPQ